jgi:phosphoserine aminotransferase
LDISRYAMIYAGAQKNVGPAGVTLVVMSDEFYSKALEDEKRPTMLGYKVHVDNKSLYNTAPVFSIYMVGLVLKWVEEEMGGLSGIHAHNQKKAALLYQTIDQSNGYYRGHAEVASRSLMNVTWRLPSEDLEKQFVQEAQARGLDGLKGHRSVGGIRASIYNAFPYEGVEALVSFMEEFRRQNG